MTADRDGADSLLRTYAIMLHEVAGYDIGDDRLAAAMPLMRHMAVAIRLMDEVDVSEVEPMLSFRCRP
jgi:hypothetical protein